MRNKSHQIGIIAMGGGASSILKNILEKEPHFSSVSINRDKQSLKQSNAELKLFVEGDKPAHFPKAIEQHRPKIKEYLGNIDALVLLSCLGGITGSHTIQPLAKMIQDLGTKAIAVVTLPFEFEGKARMAVAQNTLDSLTFLDMPIVIIHNQSLISLAKPNFSLADSFQIQSADIAELVSNYSFEDELNRVE